MDYSQKGHNGPRGQSLESRGGHFWGAPKAGPNVYTDLRETLLNDRASNNAAGLPARRNEIWSPHGVQTAELAFWRPVASKSPRRNPFVFIDHSL
jgi:hypothetical protein